MLTIDLYATHGFMTRLSTQSTPFFLLPSSPIRLYPLLLLLLLLRIVKDGVVLVPWYPGVLTAQAVLLGVLQEGGDGQGIRHHQNESENPPKKQSILLHTNYNLCDFIYIFSMESLKSGGHLSLGQSFFTALFYVYTPNKLPNLESEFYTLNSI